MPIQSGLNTLEFRTELTNELDKVLVQKSVTTGFLDNSFGSKFVGTRTILIPDVDFTGLGDYDRAEGFPEGGITVEHKPYELTMERGKRIYIDRMDMDEIGISGLAGQIMGEFIRTKAAPELDAYCLSKLATIAVDAEQTVTGEMANGCVKILNNAIRKVQDEIGYDEELVAFVNSDFYGALMDTTELTRRLNIADFKKGEINTKVKKLDECSIIPVPMSRMKTAFVFNDGITDGQKEGGFTPDATAKNVGCIVLPKRVVKLVKKLEKVRVFTPDQCQKKDAYQFDFRTYYDLFVKNSEVGTVFAHTY